MPLGDIESFDAIHVISDLHMGGLPGFQIMRATGRLAGYVRRLAKDAPGQHVALVLNGDVFDTLAEDTGGYIAIDQAATTVGHIMDDASFSSIWDAFAEFVQTDCRKLVIVIGNHDIEIAFPPVQRLIVDRLAGADPAARGRLEFSIMGAGYTCMVGKLRVYCIHGNEVDAWNYNRYEDLARVARRLNAGQPFDPAAWRPNAGTRMVKDVMNTVKRRYAWIDLLKPETEALIGTLLAIDPSQAKKLDDLVGIFGEKLKGELAYRGRLSSDDFSEPPTATLPETLEKMLGPSLQAAINHRPVAEDMLLAAEERMDRPLLLATPDETLGTGQLVVDRLTGWMRGVEPQEALRRALQDWLRGDKTFDFHNQDDTCVKVMNNVGPAVDIVVTGHTHLARAIDLGGGRLYFNSGTWIRLMQLSEAMLATDEAFAPIYGLLKDGTMAALDAAQFGSQPLLPDRTSEVEIASDANGVVVGRLNWVTGDGSAAPQTHIELRGHQ